MSVFCRQSVIGQARTVLVFETEHGDEDDDVGERDAERYEVVERPVCDLGELGRNERRGQGADT